MESLTANKLTGGLWPNHEQQLLLQAILCSSAEAEAAYAQWKNKAARIENLDSGSFRLLPLLYRRLSSDHHHAPDPLLPKLKGIYRIAWFKNQHLFHALDGVLKILAAAHIETMVLKGAALTALYYKDTGSRTMQDLDIVVPMNSIGSALQVLKAQGWRVQNTFDALLEKRGAACFLRRYHSHAVTLINNSGQELDLHWNIMRGSGDHNDEAEHWRRAQKSTALGSPAYYLDTTDQLLHTCVHGVEWNYIPPVRWLADAACILRNAPDEPDWQRLIMLARKMQTVLPVYETLYYLKNTVQVAIPEDVLANLRNTAIARWARLEHRLKGRKRTWFDFMIILTARYWFVTKGENPAARVLILAALGIKYLCQTTLTVLQGVAAHNKTVEKIT